ncbi:MAG: AbgT family transporter, partial [Thermomicrobiales bacterium]|nr:AbgT family transporter [Thermomicrobiales bacterium]
YQDFYEDTTGTSLEGAYTGGLGELSESELEDNTLAGAIGEVDYVLEEVTIPIRPIFSVDGIRMLFTTFVSNFQGFGVIGVALIAMLGAGAAEGAGMMGALIRKIVASSPKALLTFFIVIVGGLSSIASDAGYLILVPLAAAAFKAVGRNPIAGMAAGFAAVACTFAVNVIPQPLDAMLTEITNEAIGTRGDAITLMNNYYFGVASFIVLAIVCTFITERIIEPRLGTWTPDADYVEIDDTSVDEAGEARGLRFALYGFLGVLAIVLLFTIPSGAALRHPETGDIIGQTPFMDSLLFIIALFFLVSGICYGVGAGTVKSANDVIGAIVKTWAGMAGLILMFLMIAQFIAYFNYTHLPQVIAVGMAHVLESLGLGALPLMLAFILVIILLDFILPGALPKWAIFAPIFVPVFYDLNISPQALLAAYRIGDSPVNPLTPLMVYLPFIVTVAQRYKKESGVGTIISLMLPYALLMAAVWIVLFIAWYVIDLPLGPGYPFSL